MSLKSLAQGLLGVVAPTIGTALLGPFGGIAGAYLAEKLGVKESDLPQHLSKMTPELVGQLKQLDQDFDLKMKSMDVDIFQLEIDDKKSARDMAKVNMVPQVTLSVLFVLGYFSILCLLMGDVISIPDGFREGTLLLLGILTREIPTIMQFWFGSSHGSKSKSSAYEIK